MHSGELSTRARPAFFFLVSGTAFPETLSGMSKAVQHWMVKQEPTAYAWAQFAADGETAWTGVRNFQARNNLRAMKKGDLALYYHSVVGKEVVGVAKVQREAYPDPTATEGDWDCVDLVPVNALAHPVSLESIKKNPVLKDIALVRQSRLSVIPLTPLEYAEVVRLGSQAGS
jgi:predicted RNA-binding protein with PUA-like domain